MKRVFTAVLACMLVTMTMVTASAAGPARPYGNPTPCYGGVRSSEIDMNNLPENDSSVDGDTNEIQVNLYGNASGFQPYCSYSYTITLDLQNAAGGTMSGTAHIRVWARGVYEGDFRQGFINVTHEGFTTPYGYYYGTSSKQADNYNTSVSLNNNNFYYHVYVSTPGYVNF